MSNPDVPLFLIYIQLHFFFIQRILWKLITLGNLLECISLYYYINLKICSIPKGYHYSNYYMSSGGPLLIVWSGHLISLKNHGIVHEVLFILEIHSYILWNCLNFWEPMFLNCQYDKSLFTAWKVLWIHFHV